MSAGTQIVPFHKIPCPNTAPSCVSFDGGKILPGPQLPASRPPLIAARSDVLLVFAQPDWIPVPAFTSLSVMFVTVLLLSDAKRPVHQRDAVHAPGPNRGCGTCPKGRHARRGSRRCLRELDKHRPVDDVVDRERCFVLIVQRPPEDAGLIPDRACVVPG